MQELSKKQKRRYARHVLLPEIGPVGQARLCQTRFRIDPGADPRAASVAADYLERAGLSPAHVGEEEEQALRVDAPDEQGIARLAGAEHLQHAAAALAGAFTAVETLKQGVGMQSEQAKLPSDLVLVRPPDAED